MSMFDKKTVKKGILTITWDFLRRNFLFAFPVARLAVLIPFRETELGRASVESSRERHSKDLRRC